MTSNPQCVDNFQTDATITVIASDNVGVVGVVLTIDPPGSSFYQKNMTWMGGNTWQTFIRVGEGGTWSDGNVTYSSQARDAHPNYSSTYTSNPFSDDNRVSYSSSGCSIG